jgi:hypothetical protein
MCAYIHHPRNHRCAHTNTHAHAYYSIYTYRNTQLEGGEEEEGEEVPQRVLGGGDGVGGEGELLLLVHANASVVV